MTCATQTEWPIGKQLVNGLDVPSQTHTASWQSLTND